MKKLFAVLAIIGVMTSCKGKKKDEKKMDDTTTVTPTTDTTTTTTTTTATTGDIPKFSDPEVQKYVDDYTAFVTSYVDAYKSKDYTKITKMSTDAATWAGKTQSISMKLANNPDEATKFTNYMTKLSQDIVAAMGVK